MGIHFNSDNIEDLMRGDEKIFEKIFKFYFNRLVYYAQEFILDEEVAKEIVQDIFMKLWERKETLSENTNIQAYLFVLTRNQCLNYLKHIKIGNQFRKYSQEQARSMELNLTALEDECSEKLIAAELEQRINEAVDSLPDQCKKVFEMSRYDGLKYKQIAEKLNISVKAVEANISRALRQLSEYLKDYLS